MFQVAQAELGYGGGLTYGTAVSPGGTCRDDRIVCFGGRRGLRDRSRPAELTRIRPIRAAGCLP